MELSNEDHLRLNVLLQNVEAVRIDEQAMVVYGLSPKGEAKVRLNPNCREDKYLKMVREFLSWSVLGSPSGYPLHLERWTRMGQTKDTNLAELLMLGEPEAITAVVCAEGLTDELARRAWWAAPTAENACQMLRHACVIEGGMGRVLVNYLVEYLPFEAQASSVVRIVRLLLRSQLLDSAAVQRLWERGLQKAAYRVGFLEAVPDQLPEPVAARADFATYRAALDRLVSDGNAAAALLAKVLDSAGQSFIANTDAILKKLSDQDVTVMLFNLIGRYFEAARGGAAPGADMETVVREARTSCGSTDLQGLRSALPDLAGEIDALCALSRVNETLLNPIFSKTTAVGSLMRRKLEPITRHMHQQFAVLRQARRA